MPIESKMISNRIEAAQKAVESQNFESRKHLLEYDDVMNKQREAIYGLRRQLLEGVDQREFILETTSAASSATCSTSSPPKNSIRTSGTSRGSKKSSMGQFGLNLGATGINRGAEPPRPGRSHL